MIAYSDLLRVSLRQVTRQKSYGVVFSIALGITAFIALAVLGQQIRYKVGQDMVLMGGVNVMRVFMEDSQYPGQPKRVFQQQSIDAIRQLKGVTSVSVSSRCMRQTASVPWAHSFMASTICSFPPFPWKWWQENPSPGKTSTITAAWS